MKVKFSTQIRIGFLFGFIILSGCQKDKPTEDDIVQAKEIAPPETLISITDASNLHKNYYENRISLISKHEKEVNKNNDFIATEYIEWDISTIENYLDYVKQEAKKTNVEISTIRFYMGQYQATGNNKKDNHNTLFMLPTMSFNGENHGFYINASGEAALLNDDHSVKSGRSTSSSLIMNRGNGGPPPKTDF